MDEAENFINFIKDKFKPNEIQMAYFIHITNLLSYSMIVERVKEKDKVVEKPTNILELSHLKLCAKKFNDSENMLEKIFLFYLKYTLREYKNTWKLNLNIVEADLAAKCPYCNVDSNACPFKLVTYIKKCISDNKFDENKIFDSLIEKEEKKYSNNLETINSVVEAITKVVKDSADLMCAEMLLKSNAIKIEKEDNEKLFYSYLDFNVKNNSFFNNLNEFFKDNKGIKKEFNLSNLEIKENTSYLFNKSPIEIAVYIRYLCSKNNIDEEIIINNILEKEKYENNRKIRDIYYKQYAYVVSQLECSDSVKEEIISILTYIRNYDLNPDLPYIHFNIALYTKNNMISDKIINLLNRYIRTLNYVGNGGMVWVDVEMLVKRTKDSTDMIMQVDKIYTDNDVVILENFDKVKTLNEFRVDALITSIEKFSTGR